MSRIYAIAAAAALAALIGGSAGYIWFARQDQGDPLAQCREGNVGGADIGGPFSLLDKNGATVTEKEAITRPTLVYFGYTFCPDVCPFDMSRNAEAVDLLKEQGRDVDLVFITIDPERDTEKVVGDYAEAFSETALGLTGSAEQIAAAAKAYRVYYKSQKANDDYYLVDHSTFTYLMLPETGFADFYRREATPAQIAKGVSCMMDVTG
ncbi:SCO family protein [Xinfangfangia sp. D13-10-4-6]|uniref:SCO family protein n=1 Tax=Pseudogemmobacter hezensis TaxID=2737662 RepID=UPI001553CBCB|nr:SCO family protein [Pseudogemmobacter hezensis]NPD14289.1 SCO family protein [Pseudogemmobacter hezensis]